MNTLAFYSAATCENAQGRLAPAARFELFQASLRDADARVALRTVD